MAVANWPHLQDRDIRWQETVRLWTAVMADIPYLSAERAMLELLKTARYFPAVGEVREKALAIHREDQAEQLMEEHARQIGAANEWIATHKDEVAAARKRAGEKIRQLSRRLVQ